MSAHWVNQPPPPGASALTVQVATRAGRQVITGLTILGDQLTVDTFRRVSLARIEAELNRGPVDPGERSKLHRPDGSDSQTFYRLVARAYGEYSTGSKAPVKAIAEEADVPVTTAHRWVREARRRGYLPPARKGAAG